METSVSFAGDLTDVHVFKVYMSALKKKIKKLLFYYQFAWYNEDLCLATDK